MGLAPRQNINFSRLYEINLYHSNKALDFFRNVRFWHASCFISMFYRAYPVVWIMIKFSDGPSIFLPNCVNHSVSHSSLGWYPRIKSAVREQISNVRINTEFLLKYNLFFPEDSLVIMWNNLLCLPCTPLPIRHCSHTFFSMYKIR